MGATEQIARSWRIFAAAVLMAAAARGTLYLQRGNNALALLLAGASETVVYFAACKYFSLRAVSQMFAVFAPAPKKVTQPHPVCVTVSVPSVAG